MADEGTVDIASVESVQSISCDHSTAPIWDESNEVFYFIDITNNAVHRYHPESGATDKLNVQRNFKVNFIALTENTDELLVGCGHLVMKLYIDKDNTMRLDTTSPVNMDLAVDLSGKRIGLGKCSPYGELFFSVEPIDRSNRVSSSQDVGNLLYRMLAPKANKTSKHQQYTLQEVFPAQKAPGRPAGVCWDHGGRSLYVTDAATKRLLRYVTVPFRSTLENREDVIDFARLADGTPTGIDVDKKGFIWVAMDGAGEVLCIDPTKGFEKGEVTHRIKLPVKNLTSCAFGGNNLEELFVTSRVSAPPVSKGSIQRPRSTTSLFRVRVPGNSLIPCSFTTVQLYCFYRIVLYASTLFIGVSGSSGAYRWKPFSTTGKYTTTLGMVMIGCAITVWSAAEIASQQRGDVKDKIAAARGGSSTNE
jgi:sugar lactone lactonase YvrE